jgi:hypothetical protein
MQVVKIINALLERVSEILTDTRQWPAWGPSVSHVDCPFGTAGSTVAGVEGRRRRKCLESLFWEAVTQGWPV